MIIWSRWGILVFVFFGLSVGLGYLLRAALAPGLDASAPQMNFFIGTAFLIGAAVFWAFCVLALPKLDKPKPIFVYEKLSEPATHPDGSKMTHRSVPVVHPETGQQVWQEQRSTFFFIPMRFWPYLIAAVGVVVIIVGATRL